ncbi:MAG TPA: hypothetical protein PK640_06250 [Verrucomicrobiota bacterium]|nr:hypothetical protein [Verrucomicrobiota bacterium]
MPTALALAGADAPSGVTLDGTDLGPLRFARLQKAVQAHQDGVVPGRPQLE